MTVRKTVRFAKTHALGNDFLVVGRKELPAPEAWPAVARAICHRRRGIGADGLAVFETGGGGAFSMVLLNQDGSHAEISGNGLRCLGAYLRLSGLANDDKIVVETGSGTRTLEFIEATG
ncbi:MAG: diaminopimelate epimerase, partial [Vicinamibacteria bacterium]